MPHGSPRVAIGLCVLQTDICFDAEVCFFLNTEYSLRLKFLLLHELNVEEGIFKAYFREMLTLHWFC